MAHLKCLRCENAISGNHLNALILAQNTPGWVAWLNGSCTSTGLCPQHSETMIAAMALLEGALGSQQEANNFVRSTFVAGPTPPGVRTTLNVKTASTATCGICGEAWSSETCPDPVGEATKCAAQGEPPKPPWFDRIAEKGAFAFGAFGVRGDNGLGGVDSEAAAAGCWRIKNSFGEHAWYWRLAPNAYLSALRDQHGSSLPIEAVDPERGFDLCRYVKPNDAMRAYWRYVATMHYGIASPVMPEVLKEKPQP